MMRRRLPILLALCLGGCVVMAGKADYRAYRATRLAEPGPERLLAMQAYLRAHPEGAWADDIARARAAEESAVYEAAKDDRAGLQLYLRAFPDGAFAAQARKRLQAIEVIEARRALQAQQEAQALAARTERQAELRRTWVTRFVGFWGRTFAALERWGAPIAEVAKHNPGFSQAFGRSPRPRCTRRECVKYYDATYAIPVPGGTRIERRMRLVLRLQLSAGELTGADLLLPKHGFSRWFEHEQGRIVVDEDPTQRAEAVTWAVERLQGQLGQAAGELLARGPVAPPAIEAPELQASGERIDTSVEDPSAPANRIEGADARTGEADDPASTAAPDMVLGGLEIGPGGQARDLPAEEASSQQAEGEGDVMVLDALSVTEDGELVPGEASTPAPVAPSGAQPEAHAFTLGSRLEIIVFSSGVGAGEHGFDGIRIRPLSATRD